MDLPVAPDKSANHISWKAQARVTTNQPTILQERHGDHPDKRSTSSRVNRQLPYHFAEKVSVSLVGSHVIWPTPANPAKNRTPFGSDSCLRDFRVQLVRILLSGWQIGYSLGHFFS